jgi:hypothetical protein
VISAFPNEDGSTLFAKPFASRFVDTSLSRLLDWIVCATEDIQTENAMGDWDCVCGDVFFGWVLDEPEDGGETVAGARRGSKRVEK